MSFLLTTRPASAELDTLHQVADHESAVRAFIDCQNCDNDYIRSEITFVNYVRDRHDAQVHILITTQPTGSGGREYTLTFVGQHSFAGVNDTLRFASAQFDTDDVIRRAMIRILKLGLVRYVKRTPLADQISVSYDKPGTARELKDSWDYWVFRTSLSAYLSGQKSSNSLSLYTSISASRVTSELKVSISAFGDYSESNFDIDSSTISSLSRSKGFNSYLIFSLDDHWSTGADLNANSSTYQNLKVSVGPGTGIEYNVFPYSESTRRQLRLAYSIAYRHTRYVEETIYNKTQEGLFNGQLSATLELKQTWGTVEARVEGFHYFHHFSRNRVEFFTELSLSLFEGLSLDLFGSASMIHDQLSLPKRGASTEEILLQRRQLETQFNYFGSLGLSYSFGSIYNNIVNPRFGSF